MTVERAARNIGWVFGLYLLRRIVRLGYFISFARLLEQSFGSYYFLLSLVNLFPVIAAFGMNVFLVRQLHRGEADRVGFISRCFGMNLTSSLVFTAAVLAVAPFTHYGGDVRLGMAVMACSIVPMCLISMMNATSEAHEKLWIFAVLDNTAPIVEAGVGFALLVGHCGLVSLCVLHLAIQTVYAAAFFVLVRRHIVRFGFRFDPRAWLGYLRESWKIWAFSVQSLLYVPVSVVILSAIADNRQVGYFAAAMALVEILPAAANAFRAAVFPYMVRAWERTPEELKGFQESCVRLFAAAAVPIGLLGVLLAGPLVPLLFGKQYLSSIPVLQILAWMVFPVFLEQVQVRVCYASGHSLLPIVGHTVVNALRIVLSVVLVLAFGERASEGLAWALLASSLAGFLIYTVLIRRYTYAFEPMGPLARTAGAAAVPVLLVILLGRTANALVLSGVCVAVFAAGAFVFRIFTAREVEVLRRAARSLRSRRPEEVIAEPERDEPEA